MKMKRKWTAEEVRQWYTATGAISYTNPEDLNIIVKKPKSEGVTLNWANPKSYLLVGVILISAFVAVHFLKR